MSQTVVQSVYGGGRVGEQITQGVDLGLSTGSLSSYNLNNGYSSPTGSVTKTLTLLGSGTFMTDARTLPGGEFHEVLRDDPSLVSGTSTYAIGIGDLHILAANGFNLSGGADLMAIVPSGSTG